MRAEAGSLWLHQGYERLRLPATAILIIFSFLNLISISYPLCKSIHPGEGLSALGWHLFLSGWRHNLKRWTNCRRDEEEEPELDE